MARQTSLGIGLAFVVGVLVFFTVFEAVKIFGHPHAEPLIPIEKRQPSSFQARYLPPAGAAGTTSQTATAAGTPERVFNLRDQQGKVVVVNIFATWCAPCRAELPDLKSLAREYAPRGVVFVAMSLDQEGEHPGKSRDEVLQEFVKQEDPPFPVLAPSSDSILWKTANVPIPQTFLYDKHGRNARVIVGGIEKADLRESIEELLKE